MPFMRSLRYPDMHNMHDNYHYHPKKVEGIQVSLKRNAKMANADRAGHQKNKLNNRELTSKTQKHHH